MLGALSCNTQSAVSNTNTHILAPASSSFPSLTHWSMMQEATASLHWDVSQILSHIPSLSPAPWSEGTAFGFLLLNSRTNKRKNKPTKNNKRKFHLHQNSLSLARIERLHPKCFDAFWRSYTSEPLVNDTVPKADQISCLTREVNICWGVMK